MKHIIETGTDAATVCFFDPAALPADFDEKSREHPFDVMEELANEGRIWFQETGSDGGFLFHFYVDEEVPENVRQHAKETKEVARFLAPGGAIWACGAEYVARDPVNGHGETPRGGLGRFPHMGGRFELPAGEYALTAWRTEWPKNVRANQSKPKDSNQPGPSTKQLQLIASLLFFVSTIATLYWVYETLGYVRGRVVSPAIAWSWVLLLVLWGASIYFMRKLARAQKNPARRELLHEFPDVVVKMRKLG